jgi:N-carbamoyl-L-amino-acid hydrolase
MTTLEEAAPTINQARLLSRLTELGRIGEQVNGGRTRLALTMEDKRARDLVVSWLDQANAKVRIDRIGNIYGVLDGHQTASPVMIGSHIDSVVRAGAYDGCYGVLTGIEVLDALARRREQLRRSVVVVAFTNEEGVRFAPDLLGSRVMVKDVALDEALVIRARDGVTVAEELRRIGYAGDLSPFGLLPSVYLELHIEQGPVLDAEEIPIGIVEAVQGHSWWRIIIDGTANHAGTTPMAMRHDAGLAAMMLATRLVHHSRDQHIPNVATVGALTLEPNAINVVPGRAIFTVDFRDYRDDALRTAERLVEHGLRELDAAGFITSAQCLSRHRPVSFNPAVCKLLETTAAEMGLRTRRMNSGASHDAQMLARICPSGMIFVPSEKGISHNPKEYTQPDDLARGADLLLSAVIRLADVTGVPDGTSDI